jgi:hypothetical protein
MGPLGFLVDEQMQSYTITKHGRPVLTYRFGEAPLPAGVPAGHFAKRETPYEIVEFVGAGGRCIVLRAYDTKLRRTGAVKAMASGNNDLNTLASAAGWYEIIGRSP